MKNLTAVILCGLMILSIFIFTFEINAQISKSSKDSDAIDKLLPENTEFLMKLSSIEEVYKYLSITENSVFSEPVSDLKELKKELGFNPLSIKELKSIGLDVNRELAIAVTDMLVEEKGEEDFSFKLLLLIPVLDGKKTIAKITTLMQKKSPWIKLRSKQGITVIDSGKKHKRVYLGEKSNYLILGFDSKKDNEGFIQSVLTGQSSLANAKLYQKVTAKMNPQKQVFIYFNLKRVVNGNSEIIKMLVESDKELSELSDYDLAQISELLDYEGGGLVINLESPDFIIRSMVQLASPSKTLDFYKKLRLDKKMILGLEEDPVMLLSIAFNIKQYYELMIKSFKKDKDFQEFQKETEKAKKKYGIDFKKDVIDNLEGVFNFGMYDGVNINMIRLNMLLTINVKDSQKASELIKKLMKQISAEMKQTVKTVSVDNIKVYIIPLGGFYQLHIGVKDNKIILTLDEMMFSKAINSVGSKSFVNRLSDKELSKRLRANSAIFFMDFNEMLKVLVNFWTLLEGKSIDQETKNIVNGFQYIFSSNLLENRALLSHFVIKTRFNKPFLIAIKELYQSLDKKFPGQKQKAVKF